MPPRPAIRFTSGALAALAVLAWIFFTTVAAIVIRVHSPVTVKTIIRMPTGGGYPSAKLAASTLRQVARPPLAGIAASYGSAAEPEGVPLITLTTDTAEKRASTAVANHRRLHRTLTEFYSDLIRSGRAQLALKVDTLRARSSSIARSREDHETARKRFRSHRHSLKRRIAQLSASLQELEHRSAQDPKSADLLLTAAHRADLERLRYRYEIDLPLKIQLRTSNIKAATDKQALTQSKLAMARKRLENYYGIAILRGPEIHPSSYPKTLGFASGFLALFIFAAAFCLHAIFNRPTWLWPTEDDVPPWLPTRSRDNANGK